MNMRYVRLKLYGSLILPILALAIILAGCFSKTPAVTEPVLDPKQGITKVLSGNFFTSNPRQAISPGGDYLLATAGTSIVAVSLKERGAGDVVLYTVSGQDSSGSSDLVPVGWTSPTTCDHVAGVLFLEDKKAVWLVGPEDSRMLYG